MKKELLIFVFACLPFVSYSQDNELPDPEAYFSALIVDNIETSIKWYVTNLGFKVLTKNGSSDSEFMQANLKRGNVLIELIELRSAVWPKDVVPNYNARTRLKGLFKIGFQISNFDDWIRHLTRLKVKFHGRVVKSNESGKKMVIIKDPDGNRIQLFEK